MSVIDEKYPKLNQLIEYGYSFKFGNYFNRGLELFGREPGMFIGFTALFFLIAIVSGFIPFGSLIITPPIAVGYYLVARKIENGEHYEFGDFFKGFDYFGHLVLGQLISGLFIVVGILLLIIPGIYLGVALSFVSLLIVFEKMEFWPAIQYSIKIISKDWFSFFGFLFVLALFNLLGVLLLGVGLLATVPISSLAIYAAYTDIVGGAAAEEIPPSYEDDLFGNDEFETRY